MRTAQGRERNRQAGIAYRRNNLPKVRHANRISRFVCGITFAPRGGFVVTVLGDRLVRDLVTGGLTRHGAVVCGATRIPKAKVVAVEFGGERMIHQPVLWDRLSGAR